MAGGLDNLSAEGLSQLSSKLNEATRNLEKALKQQEELLKITLETEQKIISARVTGLKDYNDGYSRLLNGVKSEISYLSAEMFKITEASEEATEKAERAAEQAKQAQKANNASFGGDGSRSAKQTVPDNKRSAMGDANSANWEAIGKKRKDILVSIEELQVAMDAREKERAKERAELEKDAYEATLNAMMAKEQASSKSAEAETARADAAAEAKIRGIYKAAEAERSYYDLINKITAEQEYLKTDDAAEKQAEYLNALENEKALQALQADWDKQRQELIYQEQLKNGGKLDAAAMARVNAEMAIRKGSAEDIEKRVAKVRKQQIEEERKSEKEHKKQLLKEGNQAVATAVMLTGFSAENSLRDRIGSLREMRDDMTDDKGNSIDKGTASLLVAVKAISSLAQQLESKIDEIASMKGAIDTRLQGSNNDKDYTGSYWDRITKDIISVGAVNPFFKQEKFAKKIEELVDAGIAFDLEQRAFLGTISDKIATTFNVADGTLLRLIRIQQQDSTAGRLGMESALNTFLNNMYENTEYLKTVASSVKTSLEEMQSLMEGAEATEVEYQVQKWMGSLYSVGMSQNAVTGITNALGQIAAGQIEGLTGDGAGNLLIMAANNAGLPIADILAKGLDADETNELLQATVNYLAELAESSKDNHVVQQQLANIFGVKASDLKAATNLTTKGSVGTIYGESLTYDNMLQQLYKMAATMGLRTSVGEMMTNVWDNVQYTLAGSMASSPISYLVYKMAGLLESTTGGIDIGLPMIMGNGLPVQFKVSDLMRAGAMAGGILGTLPQMINGLVTSTNGALMLASMGVDFGSGLKVTPRGDGTGLGALAPAGGGVQTTSSSGYIGNAAVSDIKNSTIQQNENEVKQQVIEAQEDAEATQIDSINTTVLKIYELLDDVAHGNGYLRVKVEGYGLTKASNSGSTLGGVGALDSLGNGSSINTSSGSSGSLANGGVNSSGFGGNVSLSGWTTTV